MKRSAARGTLARRRLGWLARRLAYPPLTALTSIEKRAWSRGWRDPSSLTLPRFLGIGAPQSGSTWLHRNLAAHPGLYLPATKELHYFDRHFYRSLSAYSTQFADAGSRIPGEITPGYSALRADRVAFVRAVMPQVRLVYVVRNPIERAWSGARRVFASLTGNRADPFDGVPDDEIYAYFRLEGRYRQSERPVDSWGSYEPGIARSDYATVLAHWRAHFPREQLFLGFFDDIVGDPRGLLTRIFGHIGASTDVDWGQFPLRDKVNPNPPAPMPEHFEAYLSQRFGPTIRNLAEEFGGAALRWRDRLDESQDDPGLEHGGQR